MEEADGEKEAERRGEEKLSRIWDLDGLKSLTNAKFIPQLCGDRAEDPDGPRLLSSRFRDTLILIKTGRTISYNLFDFDILQYT